jgi:hypothetical protein
MSHPTLELVYKLTIRAYIYKGIIENEVGLVVEIIIQQLHMSFNLWITSNNSVGY